MASRTLWATQSYVRVYFLNSEQFWGPGNFELFVLSHPDERGEW